MASRAVTVLLGLLSHRPQRMWGKAKAARTGPLANLASQLAKRESDRLRTKLTFDKESRYCFMYSHAKQEIACYEP